MNKLEAYSLFLVEYISKIIPDLMLRVVFLHKVIFLQKLTANV